LQPLYDCELIAKATETSSQKWTYEQKGAVAGKYWGYCVSNGTRYPNARPTFCDATVAEALANDPVIKQKGARCTFQDNLVNLFGRDPKTGFARNPFDNVGVQYGLNALNEGKISFDQFLDLNARIGGLDVDGKIIAARQVADGLALRRAYASGRVNTGGAGLATTPMVDIRSFVNQKLHTGQMTSFSSPHNSCPTVLSHHFDIRSTVSQILQTGQVTSLSSQHNSCPTVLIRRVDFRSSVWT
jgi:hypothetical protein